jgi:hypothetical protein
MNTAGWLDVWHLALAVVARQSPFAQIMFATGAVFVVVMALEGLRTSLLAIWRAHKAAPAAPQTRATTLAMPADGPLSKGFSARAASPRTASAARRPKPVTLTPRQFRSPRPKIRRHGLLDFAPLSEFPESPAHAPLELPDAL